MKREQRLDDGMGGQVTQEELFGDYQETDHVKLPRKLVTFADGKKIAEASITEVQLLDKIADQEFDKPGDPPDAPKKGIDQEKQQPRSSDQQASPAKPGKQEVTSPTTPREAVAKSISGKQRQKRRTSSGGCQGGRAAGSLSRARRSG